MADIEIATEEEGHNQWQYTVKVYDGGKCHAYDVTLGWPDYDLWSRGRVSPERVIQCAFEFLLKREPADAILSKFDCGLIRRYFPEVDKKLPDML